MAICEGYFRKEVNMSRKLRNAHYKSTEQILGGSGTVEAGNTATNPVRLSRTRNITETGVAIEDGVILATGTYRVSGDVVVEGTTAGDITIQIEDNGTALPETVRTVTVDAGASVEITTETVRYWETCCSMQHSLDLVIFSDGTAVADIVLISGNIIKLA